MDAVVAHSQTAISKGSSSFDAASRLLGRELRDDVWQLYAWCRHCDDQIDGQEGGGVSEALTAEERRERLTRIKEQVRLALDGRAMSEPAFAAFARVALKHGIPEQWPAELLEGFAQDVDERVFERQEDMLLYCWGVAGTVGVMMTHIMGRHDDAVLQRAQDLGLAFQLTNICRDVAEDARNGRVYLPAELLRAEGVEPTPDAMLSPEHREAIFRVVSGQLALAEAYYRSARRGLAALPFRGAVAVAAARDVYREIGRRVRRKGPAALQQRTRLSKPQMIIRLVRGVAVALWSRFERLPPPASRPKLWSRL